MENDKIFEITADFVTVEVQDKNTGKVYRRELPIDYTENANFLRLRAEGYTGEMSELVFFTPRGIERLHDMMGGGADHDDCGTY
ncbi:MAG: hypothetical protein IJE09_01395 [Oscillospiraceae bacterium]|nr:hypothetical protein [Oscillospiraceae bacterium]